MELGKQKHSKTEEAKMKNISEVELVSEMIRTKAKEQIEGLLNFKRENASFIELELRVCKNLNELGTIILENIIPLVYGDGYKGPKVEANEETIYNCVAKARERGLITAFGRISIKRAVYTEFHSGGIKSFLDEALDIEDKRKSPLVRYWSDLLGTVAPFDEAKSTLEKIRGISISATQIELSTESAGERITKAHNEDIKEITLNNSLQAISHQEL